MAQYRRKVALDWLRLEPYSTVAVMKLVLRISETGTRKLLDKMVVENLLLKTKVSCVGVSGKVSIYGVSSKGLYAKVDADGVEPGVDRDFKPRKYNPLTAQHAINLQLARLYYQRLDNPGGKIKRRYRADRDLPYFGQKVYRWKTYPDGIIDNSHLFSEHNSAHRLSIAIEIEQHDKGSKRYHELVKAHLENFKEPHVEEYGCCARYDKVIYLLKDENEVKNFKKTIYKQIAKPSIFKNLPNPEKLRADLKQRFIFDTYNDLAQRIRELDACVAL